MAMIVGQRKAIVGAVATTITGSAENEVAGCGFISVRYLFVEAGTRLTGRNYFLIFKTR